jgi:hypothetical protein
VQFNLTINAQVENTDFSNKLFEDSDILQALDESNSQWVTAWKTATKKQSDNLKKNAPSFKTKDSH